MRTEANEEEPVVLIPNFKEGAGKDKELYTDEVITGAVSPRGNKTSEPF